MERFSTKSGNICVNLSSSAVRKYCHLPNGVALGCLRSPWCFAGPDECRARYWLHGVIGGSLASRWRADGTSALPGMSRLHRSFRTAGSDHRFLVVRPASWCADRQPAFGRKKAAIPCRTPHRSTSTSQLLHLPGTSCSLRSWWFPLHLPSTLRLSATSAALRFPP